MKFLPRARAGKNSTWSESKRRAAIRRDPVLLKQIVPTVRKKARIGAADPLTAAAARVTLDLQKAKGVSVGLALTPCEGPGRGSGESEGQFFVFTRWTMVMFVSTLVVGAVAGFAMEQQWGSNLARWSRMQRMRARVMRRQGVSPWRAWFEDQE
jgi:hypothetical protein